MNTKEKDQKLLNLYIENETNLNKVSKSIDFTSEDPLAQIIKSLIRKTFDFDNFNTSNFVNYLIKLCQYKYKKLYNLDKYNNNEKETLIHLLCMITLDDFSSYIEISKLNLSIEEIKKLQDIFREISMVIYSLIGYSSGGNISIIEEYISKNKGEEFLFVLNNINAWHNTKKLKNQMNWD